MVGGKLNPNKIQLHTGIRAYERVKNRRFPGIGRFAGVKKWCFPGIGRFARVEFGLFPDIGLMPGGVNTYIPIENNNSGVFRWLLREIAFK